MKYIFCLTICLFSFFANAQKTASVSFEKWISLQQAGAPVISNNGSNIAYSITSTNWQNNSFDSQVWVSVNGNTPYQLTRVAKGSSTNAQFTPDGNFVGFLADRGDKQQLYMVPVGGGEALQVTHDEDGVSDYAWSPDGKMIAFTKPDADNADEKGTHNRYGGFDVEDHTFKFSHLWVMAFNRDSLISALQSPCYHGKADSTHTLIGGCYLIPRAVKLTNGNFNVSGFSWNPDGKTIAITTQPDPRIKSSEKADIALVTVASKKTTKLIVNSGSDSFGAWSPDGRDFVYSSGLNDTTSSFYKNNHLLIYNLASGRSRAIAEAVDENKSIAGWNQQGLFFTAAEKMKTSLFSLDPSNDKITPIKTGLAVVGGVALSKSGKQMAISGRSFDQLNEIYRINENGEPQVLTAMSAQLSGWKTPVNEVVSWKSKDGAVIEGVLLKPANFNPAKKYPLLVVIHGGPTGVDRPEPVPTYVYPIMQWCEKGAIVLRVNYRGSAGYGEKFRSLNVTNLGVGDMWDVMSGVDNLIKKGIVDTARMGCMGWSQGGYISAFLTTNTHCFKAISVGAGISDWMTYYVSTDITAFAPQYLQSTPWSNPKLYQKTSPITNINNATTPTLIQHGELDKRVPISDAFELYRGLQDRKIPSKLIIYKGFGHGITKPKDRLAATWHNWQWFNHYVFGEPEEKMPVE